MTPRGKVYLAGRVVDAAEATISVFDRGFLYGDSVYETLRVYSGVPFAFDLHLDRLYSSGERIGFALPWTRHELRTAVGLTLERANLNHAYLRIIATRGSGAIGLDPALAVEPQLVVMVLELKPIADEEYTRGRKALLVSVQRNLRAALDPQAKTGNYMNNVLAEREAKLAGADEAIMLDREGRVAEASSANVFALVDGVWCTPPLAVGILGGITRGIVLELCRRERILGEERVLWPQDLRRAPELFVCSSLREVMPVVMLDGEPVGDGRVGAATRRLLDLYRQEVRAETAA